MAGEYLRLLKMASAEVKLVKGIFVLARPKECVSKIHARFRVGFVVEESLLTSSASFKMFIPFSKSPSPIDKFPPRSSSGLRLRGRRSAGSTSRPQYYFRLRWKKIRAKLQLLPRWTGLLPACPNAEAVGPAGGFRKEAVRREDSRAR